ncbi:hypothetical protein GE061_006063 [Apolygus lucorum]|uniref:Uncharacterized protein n=1 Tax=Apolygus lucorum TaxID=248454 RepID=A0A8S9WWR1_APOLU|nr:hypothetical protein GE061_006063 [Apolygus lucorum]
MDPPRKKRSVFSVGELLSSFSNDSEKNDKALKLAMFNGFAIILVIVSVFTVCGVYFILQPFIKPLLWALLVGSALHPIKLVVANKLRTQVPAYIIECIYTSDPIRIGRSSDAQPISLIPPPS